jgi:hypothetical protein
MVENNFVTKEDLKNAIENAVAELTKFIKETAVATEAKILAEVNLRFGEFRREAKRRKNLSQNQVARKTQNNQIGKDFKPAYQPLPPEFYQMTSEVKEACIAAGWQRLEERKKKQKFWFEIHSRIFSDPNQRTHEKERLFKVCDERLKEDLRKIDERYEKTAGVLYARK